MLRSNEHGYAVMTPDKKAYSFESPSIERCKEYLHKGYIIVELSPYKCGFNFSVIFNKRIGFTFRYNLKHFLWIQFSFHWEYKHKIGKTVFKN